MAISHGCVKWAEGRWPEYRTIEGGERIRMNEVGPKMCTLWLEDDDQPENGPHFARNTSDFGDMHRNFGMALTNLADLEVPHSSSTGDPKRNNTRWSAMNRFKEYQPETMSFDPQSHGIPVVSEFPMIQFWDCGSASRWKTTSIKQPKSHVSYAFLCPSRSSPLGGSKYRSSRGFLRMDWIWLHHVETTSHGNHQPCGKRLYFPLLSFYYPPVN